MEPDIDCSGLKCPEPVLLTRKRMAGSSDAFVVLVDNATARDNVSRFARSAGGDARIEKTERGFYVFVTPPSERLRETSDAQQDFQCSVSASEKVVLITSDEIGTGAGELGGTLMKMFLYASTESDEALASIIFMNSGVRLVTENEEAAAHVRALQDRGTEVLVCGTCLDYYGLTEKLKAGRVSNMYEIQATMVGASLLVSL